MTEVSEEGGIMVEDEFSEEVSDQINLQDTGQAEHRTRVLVLKPEEILADPEAEESNSASEKVIHINTRYAHSVLIFTVLDQSLSQYPSGLTFQSHQYLESPRPKLLLRRAQSRDLPPSPPHPWRQSSCVRMPAAN